VDSVLKGKEITPITRIYILGNYFVEYLMLIYMEKSLIEPNTFFTINHHMTALAWTLTCSPPGLSLGFCNGSSHVTEKQMRDKRRPLSQ